MACLILFIIPVTAFAVEQTIAVAAAAAQPDPLFQFMTIGSAVAITSVFGQRLWRYLQKRRCRRPFHLWFVH